MTYRYLTVDGMLSGTGIRDSVEGGYISPRQLGLSEAVAGRIEQWLKRYECAHYAGFEDVAENTLLDHEGICICLDMKRELKDSKIEYYSHALTKKIIFTDSHSSH